MSYIALYRKYRPSSFDDLVGQSGVSSIIKNEILNNKLSHAYLFSGPRGTGKTSCAKIIAKMINCQNLGDDGVPCGKCDCCLNYLSSSDIVEIDAASNNGVDEIRDLRDKVNLVPTNGKYKVYIIDEVHMLTTQAFNALLKTLEEPPSHVVFILATTEFYKIPATIVSRCQKFQFFKFTNDEIVDRLFNIALLENIDVEKSILYEIARLSDGGLRDAINMLDQLSSFSEKIDINDLYKLNGVVSYVDLVDLLKFISNKDIISIVKFIDDLDNYGKSIDRFINDLLYFLKDFLLFKTSPSELNIYVDKKNKILEILDLYSVDDLYNFIFSLNDLSNKLKISSFSSVLLVTYFVNLSNELNKDDISESLNDISSNYIDSEKNDDLVERKNNCFVNNKTFNPLLDFNLKKIRINNAFTTASKKLKDEFIIKWSNIKNFDGIDKYGAIIGFIDDIDIMVVGTNNIIMVVKYDSLLDIVNNYIDVIEGLLKEVYNVVYKVIIITLDEWKYEKENYVNKIKSGYKYSYMVENENDNKLDSNNDSTDSNLNKVKDLLGEDVIIYR